MVINPIRDQYEYIRDYTLISSNVLTLLLPMLLMSIFSGLVYVEMKKYSTHPLDDRAEPEKRNDGLTLMLIGIIMLFIACRIGELGISIFELVMVVREGSRKSFPNYVRAMISINTFLLVCNSSFAIKKYGCNQSLSTFCAHCQYMTIYFSSEHSYFIHYLNYVHRMQATIFN